MRVIGSIILLLVLLSKTAYGIFWQVNFRVHQSEIIRLECENKNRPELHCNGKCYLAKQLQKAEAQLQGKKQESSRSLEQLKWLETAVFSRPEFPVVHVKSNEYELTSDVTSTYLEKRSMCYLPSVFHPPC